MASLLGKSLNIIIDSGNGLSPVRHQAITWTNADLLLIGLLGTSFSEISIGILSFSFKKMHLKMLSAKTAAILSRGRWVKEYHSGTCIMLCIYCITTIHSSPPSAAYMHWWTGSALVMVMASCLFGAKPLPEPLLTYWLLDPYEQTSVKFKSKYKNFHSRKCIGNCCLRNVSHFVQGEMS